MQYALIGNSKHPRYLKIPQFLISYMYYLPKRFHQESQMHGYNAPSFTASVYIVCKMEKSQFHFQSHRI